MIYTKDPSVKSKPIVLFVLAGAHHLDLFKSVLAECHDFNWVVYIKDIHSVPEEQVRRINIRFNTRFFTDKATALAHFGTIDAVVTTFAVPHAAHLHYLDFTALAYEMKIPVFELQHGLFQIGFNIQEDSAFVGSGKRLARNSLPGPNLVAEKLRWFGKDAIGYPPHSEVNHPDFGFFDERDTTNSAADKILFMTNFHWNLISDEEVRNGYNMIIKSILSLPDCSFLISPHPAELTNKNFVSMLRRLEQKQATNYTVVRPSNSAERFQMLSETKLAISTISTVLLDLEMWRIPTFLFDLECYAGLWDGLEEYISISDGSTMVHRIKEAIYANDLPEFSTGKLQRFDADKMSARIKAKMTKRTQPHSTYIPLINKYLQQVS